MSEEKYDFVVNEAPLFVVKNPSNETVFSKNVFMKDGIAVLEFDNDTFEFSGSAWDCYTACKAIGDPVKVAEGLKELVEAAEDIQAVINESNGVVGWHLNGDVAAWAEFDLKLDAALTAIGRTPNDEPNPQERE